MTEQIFINFAVCFILRGRDALIDFCGLFLVGTIGPLMRVESIFFDFS